MGNVTDNYRGDPFAPTRLQQVDEVSEQRDAMAARLAQLGATPDEIQTLVEHWDQLDDDWTEERRTAFAGASDEHIRAALQRVRDEYPYDDGTRKPEPIEQDAGAVVTGVAPLPGQSAPPAPESSEATSSAEGDGNGSGDDTAGESEQSETSAAADAALVAGGEPEWSIDDNVREILEHVGDDKQRAEAVLTIERRTAQVENREVRKTLVERLQRIIDAEPEQTGDDDGGEGDGASSDG
jgi:hypothetical protein